MLKNSNNSPDGMWTLAVLGFVVVTVSVLLCFFKTIKFGSFQFEPQKPDATLITIYIGSTFGAYVLRRNKKDEYQHAEAMARIASSEKK